MSTTTSITEETRRTAVEVSVRATAVEAAAGGALEVYAALRGRFGADQVFLLEDLHGGDPDRGPGTVVGLGVLAEVRVTGTEVVVDGDNPLADLVRSIVDAHALRVADDVWALLRELTAAVEVRTDLPESRYAFGFLVSVGYDAVRLMEELAPQRHRSAAPDVTLTLVQHTVWFDRAGVATLIAATAPGIPEPLPPSAFRAGPSLGPAPAAPCPLAVSDSVGREEFLSWVRRCLEHIRVGDLYQVQVGHRIDVRTELDHVEVYRRLRARNPSPYMYLVNQAGTALIGASPELLFRLREGRVVMRPIAGTTRRGATEPESAARVLEMLSSTKERAEHVMLVDLCRNDIGRVCEPGTLSVDALMTVEAFSHVFHLVSTVSGQVAPEHDVWDVLCATFPAGTMTGAPKLRALEVIDSIEHERRGAYAGAVGLIDTRGWAELALCIRTITSTSAGEYSTQSCAGVVALSTPEQEWDETLAKMGAAYWALTGEELA
ncbi:anthranilate synthase component I family protein [Actinokineospora sp. G85]|uniref:anthranilate synthase component I family protein n=1 Tax=Actinokineospora sp. G85 TaxID=3406626 RepID=UPI003C73818B